MKTLFLLLVLFMYQTVGAQDTLTEKPKTENIIFKEDFTHYFKWKAEGVNRNDSIKIFSLSPVSRRVNRVNGFALGVGHYENHRITFQKINGLNIEASPISLALITFGLNIPFEGLFVGINDNLLSNTAFMDDETKTYIQINGINISSGGFMGGAKMNGLNISVLTAMNQMNGLSINAAVIGTKKFNGVSLAGIANISDYGNGIQIAPSNVCRNHKGIQIGLFNHSKNLRGLQLGLWNSNGKRKLPFINWQTKG